jgi:demethylmenaquinone methyltransferase/2-methoxy-6-polyprenyl-1,4-benzoquinol methylase
MSAEPPEQRAPAVKEMFDAISPRYDLLNFLLSFGRDRSWRTRAVRTLGLESGARLLDLACGTGDVALTAYRKTHGPGEIIGVDFSGPMLRRAEKKFHKAGVNIPYRFINADVTSLPLEDGTVDAATIAFGIRNVVDVPKALKETHRVLKPGGRLMILEFSSPKGKFFGPVFYWYFKRVLPLVGGLISGRKSAYQYLPESVGWFYTAEQLIGLMQTAGFRVLSAERYTFGVVIVYLGEK